MGKTILVCESCGNEVIGADECPFCAAFPNLVADLEEAASRFAEKTGQTVDTAKFYYLDGACYAVDINL